MPVLNPNKQHRYRAFIDGIEARLIQKVTFPELGTEVDTHGFGADVPDQETSGKPTVGELTLEKLVDANDPEDYSLYSWYIASKAGLATGYRGMEIREYNSLRVVTRVWKMTDCFVKTYSRNDFSKTDSDNIMEEVTIKPHLVYPPSDAVARNLFSAIVD